MKYLATGFHVKEEEHNQWQVIYAHAVREALNNKWNNVAQQLKVEVKGKFQQQYKVCDTRIKRISNPYVVSLINRTGILQQKTKRLL